MTNNDNGITVMEIILSPVHHGMHILCSWGGQRVARPRSERA